MLFLALFKPESLLSPLLSQVADAQIIFFNFSVLFLPKTLSKDRVNVVSLPLLHLE